ncbi:MAG: hypothetical protein P4L66_16060 [Acetobacteraceae bacterium]|nr:hypothetical protein [Acetobacteraceae bacterium]
MAELFKSTTGAKVVIASEDHCPPHVHALHRAEGWVVRLWFSFASRDTGVLSIAPTTGAVRPKQLNQMLDEISANLAACRKLWWHSMGTTCLENKWALLTSANHLAILNRRQNEAKRVRSAAYDAATHILKVTFTDDTQAVIGNGDNP